MMAFQAFEFEIANAVARITLNQPARGNPIDADFCRELKEIANLCDDNPEVRAVLMQARGKNFSVGGDLKLFTRNREALPRLTKAMTADLSAGITRLARMTPPVIMALHGLVTGGAVALAAGADIALATADARFYAAFTGIGFSCDCGTSYYLPRRVGARRAFEFLVRNQMWSASEARDYGLVNELAADEATLRANVEALAYELAQGPTHAFGEIKRLLHSTFDHTLETQLEDEAQAIARCTRTDDAWNALTAVLGKQKPTFVGS
jgi:2-(1,2-epoxy-1,2-dihydrophenyl)acetyl-CoA isomerase